MEMKGNTPFIGVLETYVEGITNLFKPKAKRNKNELPGNVIKYKAYNIITEGDYGLLPNAFGEAELVNHTFEYDEELGYGFGLLTFDEEITNISGMIGWDTYGNIIEIILPNTITEINHIGTFNGTINIPKNLEIIRNLAFSACFGMTDIIIPKSVRQIGNHPFSGNEFSIVVEKGNLYYDSRNNCNAIIDSLTNALIVGCKNTIIPEGVTSIEKEAFNFTNSAASFLKRNFTIPASVTSMGDRALYARWIENLIMESSIPPSLGINVLLTEANAYLIYVPDLAVDTYKSDSKWSSYSNRIHGISELKT